MEMVNLCDMEKALGKHDVIGAQQTCQVCSILIFQSNPERLSDLSKVNNVRAEFFANNVRAEFSPMSVRFQVTLLHVRWCWESYLR